MANSLEGVLSQIPGLAGYLAQQQNSQAMRQRDEQMQLGQLQQIGGLQGILANVQKQQQEQAFRGALAALGPEATQEQLAQVSAQFGTPKDVLQTQQSSLDRKAQREVAVKNAELAYDAKIQQAEMMLDGRIQTAKMMGANAQALEGLKQNGREQIEAMRASSREQIAAMRVAAGGGGSKEPKSVFDPNSPTSFKWDAPGRTELHGSPAPAPAGFTRTNDANAEMRSKMDLALTQIDRLEQSAKNNPRSTVGYAAPLVRGFEGIANVVKPGSVGSQANIADQEMQSLITNLTSLSKLSNKDTARIEAALGNMRSGTPQGLAAGLKDIKDLINMRQGRMGVTQKVGDVINRGGKRYRIKALAADGDHEIEEAN